MAPIAFLTDRSPAETLEAIDDLGEDVQTEPLSRETTLALLHTTGPSAVVVDAAVEPERAFNVLLGLQADLAGVPVVVVVDRNDLDRFGWDAVADEFAFRDTSVSELRLRLAMIAKRSRRMGPDDIRLGPLSIATESFQVVVAGRSLDLAYKEFELLRFLAERPGRVFDRITLLREVWGYNFYGGTRTVDVHVRRLRSKLGPQYEWLIETVRGVGYRAAEPKSPPEG